jgi:hypothetical protein
MMKLFLLVFCSLLQYYAGFIFTPVWQAGNKETFFGRRALSFHRSPYNRKKSSSAPGLTMRDRSATYWFSQGDHVEVVTDIYKSGVNLRCKGGVVIEAWEKCDVDPTCCCAEQVDCDLAIRVEFNEGNKSGHGKFTHYFNEDELRKVPPDVVEGPSFVPFDCTTCQAFKLEQMDAQRKKVMDIQMGRSKDDQTRSR